MPEQEAKEILASQMDESFGEDSTEKKGLPGAV
jgi:hypothetical protein